MSGPLLSIDREHLDRVFRVKYGPEPELGWGPRLRRSFGYHNPDDHYEALIDGLLSADSAWLDAGCGRDLFPSNRPLARQLADRCRLLVGADPAPTLEENPYVHRKVRGPIEEFRADEPFDLVTLRMVAEHVVEPERLCRVIAAALAPGGLCVVYTVFRFSPVPLLTGLCPMAVRHRVKKWLWGTETKDTFPTRFRMNTRSRLRRQFAAVDLPEVAFWRLDDCRTLGRFKTGARFELWMRRLLRTIRLPYPEQCLLGVYRKR